MNPPLDGIRVIALDQYLSVLYCSILLADATLIIRCYIDL